MLAAARTRPSRHASSPWFGGGRRAQQVGRRQARAAAGPAPRCGRGRWPRRGRSRSATASSRRSPCSARCAGPCSGPGSGRRRRSGSRPTSAEVTDSTPPREATMKTLRPVAGSLALPSKKKVRSPSAEVWNWPGSDAREVGAALELVFQDRAALVLPRPDEEREHGDQQQDRPAHRQHRPDEAAERHAAREPDRHFAARGTCATASRRRR